MYTCGKTRKKYRKLPYSEAFGTICVYQCSVFDRFRVGFVFCNFLLLICYNKVLFVNIITLQMEKEYFILIMAKPNKNWRFDRMLRIRLLTGGLIRADVLEPCPTGFIVDEGRLLVPFDEVRCITWNSKNLTEKMLESEVLK